MSDSAATARRELTVKDAWEEGYRFACLKLGCFALFKVEDLSSREKRERICPHCGGKIASLEVGN